MNYSLNSEPPKFIKFHMLEGEYFVDMQEEDCHLYVKSNLGRQWRSTETKAPYFDFVEVEDD